MRVVFIVQVFRSIISICFNEFLNSEHIDEHLIQVFRIFNEVNEVMMPNFQFSFQLWKCKSELHHFIR